MRALYNYIYYGFVMDLQVNLGENVSADHGVLASEHSPTASGTPPEAWMPPDNGRYCTADSKDWNEPVIVDWSVTSCFWLQIWLLMIANSALALSKWVRIYK